MSEDADLGKPNGLWGDHSIAPEETMRCAVGPLRLACRGTGHEIWIAHSYADPDKPAESPGPAEGLVDPQWSRWALRSPCRLVNVLPVFPDRPVVVKPENAFQLLSGAVARVYVRIPVWLRIRLPEESNALLTEIPTVVLSKTWFGAFTQGELCYWLTSSARRQIDPDPNRPHLAICPIQMENRSPTALDVEKICLRVGGLSLFAADGQLWSDETRVWNRGPAGATRVEAGGVAPPEAAGGRLLTPPRDPQNRRTMAQTFASLMDISGLGFLSL